MQARLSPYRIFPPAMKAMLGLEQTVQASGLEKSLLELVKLRASQLNGCAYCLEMHSRDAVAQGERPERLHLLAAWQEANCYTDRERAALDWTEALTLVAATRAPDAVYAQAARHFSEEELVKLTLAIVTINGWNRFAVGFRAVPGTPPA